METPQDTKGLTSAGVIIAVVAAIASPVATDKLSGEHVFWLLLVAIIMTAIGSSLMAKK